ncbi:ABC-2 family transporter protein [Bacillus sp. AFS055030]|uniref:ABC transporter permease n=1 Tax=Bacillus sp. AFS055030 TaxID=2033507 RepID=UPI000BFCB60F|nr:ABC-2 family transporter protein [Bacillus sp. AFS055030]PGL67103.1 hypothetical protein CN925_20255 [Bacillus sp. AFS055030]
MGKYIWYSFTTYKNIQVYRLDVFLRVITSILMVVAMREIWVAIYDNKPNLDDSLGVSLKDMATYATVSVIISRLFIFPISSYISSRVKTGDIILDLQKPWNFQLMNLSRAMGFVSFSLIYVIFPISIAIFLFSPINFPGIGKLFYFIISLLLSIIMAFYIDFILGLLSFLFTEIWGFNLIVITLVQLCSGSFVPLWFFPDYIERVLTVLPFQGMYYIPLSIYIGKIQEGEILYNLLFQGIWIVLLIFIGSLLIKWSEKQLLTVGG